MLLTPHVLIGLAVAKLIPSPPLAILIALFSHFLGDLIPHWDFFTGTKNPERRGGWRLIAMLADFGLGVALGVFFSLRALWVLGDSKLAFTTFLCGIAAVLPDALEAPYIFMDKTSYGLSYLVNLQRKLQTSTKLFWGLFTQFVASLLSLYFLLG